MKPDPKIESLEGEPTLLGVTLGQYALVTAALADAFSLDDALAEARVDPRLWVDASRAWSRSIAAAATRDPALLEAFDERLADGQERLARAVPPLDEDVAAWFAFLRAWSAAEDPLGLLDRLGLTPSDVHRLHRHWSRRLESDAELRKQVAELPTVSQQDGLPVPRPLPRQRSHRWSSGAEEPSRTSTRSATSAPAMGPRSGSPDSTGVVGTDQAGAFADAEPPADAATPPRATQGFEVPRARSAAIPSPAGPDVTLDAIPILTEVTLPFVARDPQEVWRSVATAPRHEPPPPRVGTDETVTIGVLGAEASLTLPFARIDDDPQGTDATVFLRVPKEIAREPLPFKGAAPEAAGPKATSRAVPTFTIEQYASLSSELALAPDAPARRLVWARYGVVSEDVGRSVERAWDERLRADRELRARLRELVAQYSKWLEGQRR